jgi:hypothetical protein
MYVDKMAEVFTPKRIVLETPEDLEKMRVLMSIVYDSETKRMPYNHVSEYQVFADAIQKLLAES